MFDFAWTEIALIAVVALIAIGPKDLPVAIRTVTDMIKKARRMASEFQTHVDDLVREANLDEVRNQINEIRNMDIRGEVERAVDPDGSLRSTLASNPLAPTPAIAGTGGTTDTAVAEAETAVDAYADTMVATPEDADPLAGAAEPAAQTEMDGEAAAPAFVPPALVPKPPPAAPSAAAAAPAFIPPGFAARPPAS